MISDEELAEIEALAAATPKGPWAASHMDGGYCEVISPEEWVTANIAEVWSGQAIADFIAASRSAIPLLLSAYRELKAENERHIDLAARFGLEGIKFTEERERLIDLSVALESELAAKTGEWRKFDKEDAGSYPPVGSDFWVHCDQPDTDRRTELSSWRREESIEWSYVTHWMELITPKAPIYDQR